MRFVIFGAGGYGQTVADIARQSGRYSQIRFLDDGKTGPEILGRCADFLQFADGDTEMYPAFGSNAGRLEWLDRLESCGIPVPTLVHSTAYVSPTVTLAPGTMILPKAVVNTGCQIRKGCIVNCGAIVDHGCVLEEGVHVCLGAVVKAENQLPACFKVEAGQVIANRAYPVSIIPS